MGAKDRLREFFLAHLDEVVDTHTLAEVAGIREYARRIRELRDEEGYNILSHRDRADLKPGQYVLRNPKPSPRFGRCISATLRAKVLRRNGYTCQVCGLAGGDPDPTSLGRRIVLHIDHIVPVSEGGSSDPGNLRVLCSACNAGRSNLEQPPDEQVLSILKVVRRAPREVQRSVHEFLRRKFEDDRTGAAD